jgi:Tol biopolymer transport system component
LFPTRIDTVGRHLDWSPTGKYLAAADKDSTDEPFSIVLIEADTGHKIQITNPSQGMIGDMSPAFSPDGRTIAFIRSISSGVNDVYVAPSAGGEVRRITNDRRYIIGLTWTPDGRSIVFSSNRTGAHALWRASIDGGAIERVAGLPENISDPAFSRDGKKLAFAQSYIDTNIWRLDLQSGELRSFITSTQFDTSPQYSPDGSRIAFRSSRSGRQEIWVAETSNPLSARQLTRTAGNLTGSPRWSPDGTRIACDARPDGQPDIFVVDAATGQMTRITTESSEDVVPSWSNDGKWIYFASNRTGSMQVWKSPSSGGAAQQVTREGGFATRESADAKYLYYAKGRTLPGLWRVPVEGGTEEQVFARLKPGYWGYWSICDGNLYLMDKESPKTPTALFKYELSTHKLTRLRDMARPLVLADSAFSMSPDCGSILYAQRDEGGSDIMFVELSGK